MKDDDVTPPRTQSALRARGLATCPCCEGSKVRDGEDCPYCHEEWGSTGYVTLQKHHLWVGLKPTDPAPPDIILTDEDDDDPRR